MKEEKSLPKPYFVKRIGHFAVWWTFNTRFLQSGVGVYLPAKKRDTYCELKNLQAGKPETLAEKSLYLSEHSPKQPINFGEFIKWWMIQRVSIFSFRFRWIVNSIQSLFKSES